MAMPLSAPPPVTGTQPPRYRPLTPAPVQAPGSPVHTPPPVPLASDIPPGGYNNPANAPQNDSDALPPRPAKGQTFGINKAQGGNGPAANPDYQDPTGHAPVVTTITNKPQYTQPPPPPTHVIPPPGPATPTLPITSGQSPVASDLRGDTYLPGTDPRLTAAQSATDAANAAIQGYDRTGMQTGNEDRYRSLYGTGAVDAAPLSSARTDAYGVQQDQALNNLTTAPNRTQLALQTLNDFNTASDEQRQKDERALGQNIAKFGRVGMQSNANDFGEITRKIAQDRGALQNQLASQVAEGDINDRYRTLDTLSGLRGQEAGLDASNRDYTTGLAERNSDAGFTRQQAAVNAATGQTDRSVGDLYDQANAAGTLEDRVFGQGQSNRNEYRTERERQDQQAQQTIENKLLEYQTQQQLEDAKLRRAAQAAQAGGLY